MKKPITLDFETKAIEPRPDYPPKAVGLAVWEPGKKPYYLAWGHPSNNNCDKDVAHKKLLEIWNSKRQMLFHNQNFDIEVAMYNFDLPYPSWERLHDTMILCFLNDPYANTLSLKPQADKWLNMPSEEQDKLRNWIFDHVPNARRSKTKWGAHISQAPGDLVGRYAIGDVVRTRKLFDFIYPRISKKAYQREQQLQPILLKADQVGIRIQTKKLKKDVDLFERLLEKIDNRIRNILHTSDLEVDKPAKLADAIDKMGYVKEWPLTPTGKRSVAAKTLVEACTHDDLVKLMLERGRLKTGLRTFGKPWLDRSYDGRMHCHWNQVKNDEQVRQYGARTGRLSSSPNFQNLSKEPMEGMPHPREYIVPSKGMVLLGRDYCQQELRILAYRIGGETAKYYARKPDLDLHQHAQTLIHHHVRLDLPRKTVKTIAFGLIYGMGVRRLAESLGVKYEEAKMLNNAYIDILPGFRELQNRIKEEKNITTWGGRHYEAEPPIVRVRKGVRHFDGSIKDAVIVEKDFAYKLLNYDIQGSAADCTKQAIINYSSANSNGTLLLTAHDELLTEAPKEVMHEEMDILRESMLDVNFGRISMLSDGKYSYRNWASMKAYNEKD